MARQDYVQEANRLHHEALAREKQDALRALWTPDGDRSIDRTQRGVIRLSPREMKVMEDLHLIAQKHNIEVRCPRCDYSFKGMNAAGVNQSRLTSFQCNCREFRTENTIIPSTRF